MLAVPPEVLEEAGLGEGDPVVLTATRGRIEVTPQAPDLDPEFVAWVHRHVHEYRELYQELARR